MWPLAICGACGVCCTQMAHFASLIVTGVFRYGSAGEKCAKLTDEITKKDGSELLGKSAADIADTMQGIFIAQCVLYCFYGCCIGVLLQLSVGVAMVRKAGM
mmetsp:Transcript_15126/g.19130  ORF Transcript_15126/g.19130 Transcript_15126/m.19130 type:complete len:102 (-) Transcript_15126:189-494(-)